jgi:hypothetical protein
MNKPPRTPSSLRKHLRISDFLGELGILGFGASSAERRFKLLGALNQPTDAQPGPVAGGRQ